MNIPNVISFKELIKQFPNHNEPAILEGEHFLFTLSNGSVACTQVRKCFHIGEPTMILGDSYIINKDGLRHVTTNYGSIHLKDINDAYHLTTKEYDDVLEPLRNCSRILEGLLDRQEPFKGDFDSYRYIYTNHVFYLVKPQGLIKMRIGTMKLQNMERQDLFIIVIFAFLWFFQTMVVVGDIILPKLVLILKMEKRYAMLQEDYTRNMIIKS